MQVLGALLLVGAAAAARTKHHQTLLDEYEASKARCGEHGHEGVIVMLHKSSNLSPSELHVHLKGKGRTADRFGHTFEKAHTIRAISARLSEETLEEMMADGKSHGIRGVHADCFRAQSLPAPQHESLRAATRMKMNLATVGARQVASEGEAGALSGEQHEVSNWGLSHGSENPQLKPYDNKYVYGCATGKNTILYSVDTGVQMRHSEFAKLDSDGYPDATGATRVLNGWSMGCQGNGDLPEEKENCNTLWVVKGNITDEALQRKNELPDEAMKAKLKMRSLAAAHPVLKSEELDLNTTSAKSYTQPGRGCDAHGTHTASIVLGNKHGVAKLANLVVVQGLSCVATAQDSLVVKALEQIVEDARARKPYMPGVVLLSLGGEKDIPLNEAVKRTTQHHISVVVAAGNSHTDACTTTPSSVMAAATVAAVDEDNHLGSFSSYGKCVDLSAPGCSILAAYALVGSQYGEAKLSGTSMAAPFVAGAMLQALSLYPQMTTQQTKALLRCTATKGALRGDWTSSQSGTPNVLVRFGQDFCSTDSVRSAIDASYQGVAKATAAPTHEAETFALDVKSTVSDKLRADCHALVDLLEKGRPASGQLAQSPDVNMETVMLDEDAVVADPPEGDATPYEKAEGIQARRAENALLP